LRQQLQLKQRILLDHGGVLERSKLLHLGELLLPALEHSGLFVPKGGKAHGFLSGRGGRLGVGR
jgi:hypothetical protein